MATIDKIKVGDTTYDISNIKVAEIEGVYYKGETSDEDVFIFENNNLKIDLNKNIKIDFYLYNNQELSYSFILKIDNDGSLVAYETEEGTNIILGDFLWGYSFYFLFSGYKVEKCFSLSLHAKNNDLQENDKPKIKVYYAEANELTYPYDFQI